MPKSLMPFRPLSNYLLFALVLSPLSGVTADWWNDMGGEPLAELRGAGHSLARQRNGSIWTWGRWNLNALDTGGDALTFGGRIDQ